MADSYEYPITFLEATVNEYVTPAVKWIAIYDIYVIPILRVTHVELP